MSRHLVAASCLALLSAALLVSWGRAGGGSSFNGVALEDDYLGTVDHMRDTLSSFAGQADPLASVVDYHDSMVADLAGLEQLRNDMADQCAELDGCPTGGGATGYMSGGCMRSGHMMGPGDMDRMRGDENACRDELDGYWGRCGGGAPDRSGCAQETVDHVQRMGGLLDQMESHLHSMWSTGGGGPYGHCGDHMGGGMM